MPLAVKLGLKVPLLRVRALRLALVLVPEAKLLRVTAEAEVVTRNEALPSGKKTREPVARLVKLPEIPLPEVKMVNVWLLLGVKPLMRLTERVPLRVVLPVTASWSYCPLWKPVAAVVPPISIAKVAPVPER